MKEKCNALRCNRKVKKKNKVERKRVHMTMTKKGY